MDRRILSIGFLLAACFLSQLYYPLIAWATLPKADKVVVIKSKRVLILLKDGEIIKSYKVSLGKNPVGPKAQGGDRKTPEGSYVLDSKKANSKFYLAIHISYPNKSDILNAQKLGVSPGNSIAIHGLPKDFEDIDKFQRRLDWTDGCIALTNAEMDEIWQLVSEGTPIEIKP